MTACSPTSVKQVVFFAADRTQPVLNALSPLTQSATVSLPPARPGHNSPHLTDPDPLTTSSPQVGLVGSSTPFHSPTHAPFSLFCNGELSSTGAVGVAIVGEPIAGQVEVEYAGMRAVGEPVEVTT